jgi:SpoVK/Ycf46/Vps4 family AAA+-type ATPase
VTESDILKACQSTSSQTLRQFATLLTTHYQWSDLVLPADHQQQLQEVASYLRHHEALCGDWGFGKKHALSRGVNLLFSGPSGTGKTMAAGILARDLGLELYRIDLSTVVSKYIGETEKHLSRIFDAAELGNAMLFFDEADALFGKRSEVKEAHDRYANIEVNYLLQKLEEHNGVVILASNLSKHLDDAFQRRLQFTVIFPIPEHAERVAIWRQVFPEEAPLAHDIDFDFLARRFKLTGGSIKNIALTAAFFARAEGSMIGMPHIIIAVKREFQKMGRLCQKSDFGDYYGLVS